MFRLLPLFIIALLCGGCGLEMLILSVFDPAPLAEPPNTAMPRQMQMKTAFEWTPTFLDKRLDTSQ